MKKKLSIILVICMLLSMLVSGCELSDEQKDALIDELLDEFAQIIWSEAQEKLKDEIASNYAETFRIIFSDSGELRIPKTPEIQNAEFFTSKLGNETLTIYCSHDRGFLLNHYTTYVITIEEDGKQTYRYELPETLCKGHGFFGYCTGELADMETVCGSDEDISEFYACFMDVCGCLSFHSLVSNAFSSEELEDLLVGKPIGKVLAYQCQDVQLELNGSMLGQMVSFHDIGKNAYEVKSRISDAAADRQSVKSTETAAYHYVPVLHEVVNGFDAAIVPITVANLKADIGMLNIAPPQWEFYKETDLIMKEGRKVELRLYEDQVQWRYEGEYDTDWRDLEKYDKFTGNGLMLEIRIEGSQIQWRYLADAELVLADARTALHKEVKRLATESN